MPVSPAITIEREFQNTLFRTSRPDEFITHWTALRQRKYTASDLRTSLRESDEYTQVVAPALREIQRVYDRFLFRAPTGRELLHHMESFFSKVPCLNQRRRVIEDGKLRQHLGIRPLSVEIDITTQCNLRCIMCYLSHPSHSKRKREDITVIEFARIATQVFPLCNFVALSSSVEPLLHPHFGEILAITKNFGVDHVTMTSNGLLMNGRVIDEMIANGLDSIAISIDAATKHTYERLRRGGRFETLLENVRTLNGTKKAKKSKLPWVSFNFVLMRSNINELPHLFELADQLDVKGICASHLTPYDGLELENESLAHDWQLCNEMLATARELAQSYGITVSLPPPFQGPPSREGNLLPLGLDRLGNAAVKEPQLEHADAKPTINQQIRRELSKYNLNVVSKQDTTHCLFPWHYTIIGPYGEVQPCGWWYAEPMGNVRDSSFEDIWNGDKFSALRAEHENGNLNQNCQTCPACGMGDVNRLNSFNAKSLSGTCVT